MKHQWKSYFRIYCTEFGVVVFGFSTIGIQPLVNTIETLWDKAI